MNNEKVLTDLRNNDQQILGDFGESLDPERLKKLTDDIAEAMRPFVPTNAETFAALTFLRVSLINNMLEQWAETQRRQGD